MCFFFLRIYLYFHLNYVHLGMFIIQYFTNLPILLKIRFQNCYFGIFIAIIFAIQINVLMILLRIFLRITLLIGMELELCFLCFLLGYYLILLLSFIRGFLCCLEELNITYFLTWFSSSFFFFIYIYMLQFVFFFFFIYIFDSLIFFLLNYILISTIKNIKFIILILKLILYY